MKQSNQWTLNEADYIAWGNRTLQTLAPYLIALIPVVISQVPADWQYAVLTVWILNRVWDLLRRFYAGN